MILPLTCSTESLIASTVDGNYTYVRFSNDGDTGTGFSGTYNSSTHNYIGIVVSTSEIETPAISHFVGKWFPVQEQYTYYAFATSAAGAGFSTTYTGSETYLAIKNSATEISSLQASNFTGLWFPMDTSTSGDASGEDLLTHRKTTEQFPFNPILIKNEELDNTISSTEGTPITVSSINTTSNYMVLSWVPDIDSLFNPVSGKEWAVLDLDTHNTTDYYSGGAYENIFKITGGSYATRTLNYTWVSGSGGTETNTVTSNKVALWNPHEDGFTRYANNPVLQASDFAAVGITGTYTDIVVSGGIWQMTDGTYGLLMHTSKSGASSSDIKSIYATSTNLLNWTPQGTELFTSGRPAWCTSRIDAQGTPIYLPDEDRYICAARGSDATGNLGIGWVKFDGDNIETVYEFSSDVILNTNELDNLVDGWKSGYEIDSLGGNDVNFASMVENNGVWYLISNVIGGFYGTHSGADIASALTDDQRTVSFVVDEFDGWDGGTGINSNTCTVYNLTDGSSGTVTDNDSTTVTATLSGGTNNYWNYGDEYLIKGLTARREFVSISDSPYGLFKHHKAIYKPSISNDGSLGNSHMEGAHMFIYKGIPHAFLSETTATSYSGTKGHRIISLFRFDPVSGEFIRHRQSPIFSAMQYGYWIYGAAYEFENYHTGNKLAPYIDETNNLFYLFYTGGNSGIYKVGVAYADLDTYK